MEQSEQLRLVLQQAGAALVGYGDLRSVDGCSWPVGVSVALPVPLEILEELQEGPTEAYHAMYHAWNRRLDEIVEAGAAFLISEGYGAFAQTTKVIRKDENWCTPLPHKTVATRAGLGWIGKSCLLVTPEYGSAVRISSLLTDAPLPCARPITASRCGSCRSCQEACPGQAIRGTLWNPSVARADMVDKEACQEAQLRLMRGRTGIDQALCGKCFVVCPYTRRYAARG